MWKIPNNGSRLTALAASAGCFCAATALAVPDLSVANLCTDPDARTTAEAACDHLIWVPMGTEDGWNWCVPPKALLFDEAPVGGWTPSTLCDLYESSLCGSSPLIMLCPECFPPSIKNGTGCALAMKFWMLNSMEEYLADPETTISANCDGLKDFLGQADDLVDLDALAAGTGVTVGDLQAELATIFFEEKGPEWALENESFCEDVLTCMALPDVGFTPTPAQFQAFGAAMGGSPSPLAECNLCDSEADPKSWGGLAKMDVNGDGTEGDCEDLKRHLGNSRACYAAPGTEGEMEREDALDLTAEFIAEAPDPLCPALISCLEQWIAEAMPNEGPLTATEIGALAAASMACEVDLDDFPPDFIADPDRAAYAAEMEELLRQLFQASFPPDFVESGEQLGHVDSLTFATCDALSILTGTCGGASNGDVPGAPGSGGKGLEYFEPQKEAMKKYPLWSSPVDLESGAKLEVELDIAFPTTGGGFSLARVYRSDPNWTPVAWSGERWSLSVCERLVEVWNADGPANSSVRIGSSTGLLAGPTLATEGAVPLASFDTPLALEGPTHQTITTTQVCIDGVTYPVYRVREPGAWEVDYLRARRDVGVEEEEALEEQLACNESNNDVYNPAPHEIGLPLQKRDMYGNAQTYKYLVLGAGEADVARLSRIFLTRRSGSEDPDVLEAEVRFTWILDTSSFDAGRLRQVTALRWTDEEDSRAIPIAKTEYLYFDDVDAGSRSDDLGDHGDLVQVTRSTRVDPPPGAAESEPVWYRRITQYRYHGNSSASTAAGIFTWAGDDHQLKMIFRPQQLEYAAALAGLGSVSDNLQKFAAAMLTMDDEDQAVVDPSLFVVDVASKVVEEYESSGAQRVLKQYVRSGCGCGSAAASLQRLVFSYFAYGSPLNLWSTLVEEQADPGSGWETFRATYFDMEAVGPILAGAAEQPLFITRRAVQVGSDFWVTAIEYNEDGLPELIHPPSNTFDYERNESEEPPAAPEYEAGETGFIREYEYNADRRRTAEWIINPGEEGHRFILTRTAWGDGSGNTRDYLPDSVEYFRGEFDDPGEADPDDIELIEFEYQFRTSGGDDLAAVQAKAEWDGHTFNGPGSGGTPAFIYTHEFLDEHGRNALSRAPDGSFTRREFDSRTGQVTLVERNADEPEVWDSAWEGLDGDFTGSFARGGSLTSTVGYDAMGRVQRYTSEAGVTSYLRRELRTNDDVAGTEFLALVYLPAELEADSHAGPARVEWLDAAGQSVAVVGGEVSGTYTLGDGEEPLPQAVTGYTVNLVLDQVLSRWSVVRSLSGQILNTIEWHAVDAQGHGDGVAVTTYVHDARGRIRNLINPLGTLTQYTYDGLDRVTAVKIALDNNGAPAASTDREIATYEYDLGGVGNGNLTGVEAIVNGSTSRTTTYTYDWRDRLAVAANPMPPHGAWAYDNLNRVTAAALYSVAPALGAFNPDADDADRVALERITYTQRGLMAWKRLAVLPTDDATEYLWTSFWYDEVGRPVGTWAPNSPGTKTTYDGLGRVTKVHVTDRAGDENPGVSGSFADVFNSHASVLTDDIVLEQTEYRYVTGQGELNGLLDLVRHRRRLHDTSATGALSSSTSVTMFVGIFHDAAGRPTHTVDYGTNDTTNDEFASETADPDVEQDEEPPSTGADALVTETIYDERGLVGATIDPMGRRARFLYDARSRLIATIENDTDSSVTIGWDQGDQKWLVSGTHGYVDRDRVTSYVRDAGGHLRKQTAHQPGGTDQVTSYAYGVTTDAVGPGTMYGQTATSELFSNDLPVSVTYPEGSAGSGAEFRTVYFAYNRQGEVIETVDQNNTQHVLTRDAAGRVIADKGTKGTGSSLDDAIDLIEREFDDAGRLERVTSLKDGGTPTVKNQVEIAYTPLWQIAKVYQDSEGEVAKVIGGAPDANTRLVGYSHETEGMADGNYSRVIGLDYPRRSNASGSPETLDIDYGTAGEANDLISRPQLLKINMSSSSGQVTLAKYRFLGLSTPVVVDLDAPDIQLDRTLSLDGRRMPEPGVSPLGNYPGFDKFGRVRLHIWADGDLASTGTPPAAHPTLPEIVALQYGYDYNGNRTHAYDVRYQNAWPQSHAYENDQLERLTRAMRNTKAVLTGGTPTDGAGSQAWTLDRLGNWTVASTTTSISTITESRQHNAVNEAIERDFASSSSDHELLFDGAGNLVSVEIAGGGSTTTYTHDLWNRLVKVEVDSGSGDVTKLEQEFNGLNWRTLKREDTPGSSAGLDEERTFTYSADWQLLEERVDKDLDSDLDKRVQYFWGLRHIDDCLMHRADLNDDGDYQDTNEGRWFHLTDAQFSTVAIVNQAGTLIERVSYDSYGRARHHQPGDVDGLNGTCDSADKAIVDGLISGGPITISSGSYRAEADLNRDGVINSSDSTLANRTASALATGDISIASSGGPDSSVGWCGYIFNRATGQYLVRFRNYDTALGRWLERDPAGYVDGMSLYGYLGGAAPWGLDPFGLEELAWYEGWGTTLWSLGEQLIDGVKGVVGAVVAAAAHSPSDPVGHLVSGAIEALYEEAVQATERSGTGATAWDVAVHMAGRATGMAGMAEGIAGTTVHGEALDGYERAGRVSIGISAMSGAAAGGLHLLRGGATGGAKGSCGGKGIGSGAESAVNRNKLSKSLASEDQMNQPGITMAGGGGRAPFRKAAEIAKVYGGNASDWVKKTSTSHTAPDGIKFETHWVENVRTGQRVEFKTKASD